MNIMRKKILKTLTLAMALLFVTTTGFSQSDMSEPLSGVKNTKAYSTLDLIHMDKDLSIFANLLTLTGIDTSLEMIEGWHTIFVPTNDAFADMSVEKFAELTDPKNRTSLVQFVNRHLMNSKMESSRLADNNSIDLNGTKRIKIAHSGSRIVVGDATVLVADIMTSNGIIHVVNDYIEVVD